MATQSTSVGYRPFLIVIALLVGLGALVLVLTGISGPGMWLLVIAGFAVAVISFTRMLAARNRG